MMSKFKTLKLKTLFTEAEIAERIKVIAEQIRNEFSKSENLILVSILKGSYLFTADLARAINLPQAKIDFIQVSSYDNNESTGNVKVIKDLETDISGSDVIIIEDIIDTGITMDKILRLLRARNPKSLKIATLLHKPARTKIAILIDYICFTIEPKFIVGYGLDYDDFYRSIPYVGVVEEQ